MESLESVVATAQIVSELDPMRYAVGPDGRPYITRARTSASRAGRAKTSGGVTWSPWSRGGAAAWSSAGGAVKAMLGPDSLQHETMQLLTMGCGGLATGNDGIHASPPDAQALLSRHEG
jgi:hypothetical protein